MLVREPAVTTNVERRSGCDCSSPLSDGLCAVFSVIGFEQAYGGDAIILHRLRGVPGILEAVVDAEAGTLTITHEPGCEPRKLVAGVEELGYRLRNAKAGHGCR